VVGLVTHFRFPISILVEVENMGSSMAREAMHVIGEPGLPVPHLLKDAELG
jgi:hypothetical protein